MASSGPFLSKERSVIVTKTRPTRLLYPRLLFFFAFLSLCSSTTFSQVVGIDMLGKKQKVTVPFEYEQGFIIVKLWLQGVIPLRMILDTGAQNTILFDKEIAEILGIKFERKISIIGSDLDSVLEASISRRVMTELTGCHPVRRDLIVLEDNDLLLDVKLGTEVNGIIGGGYFPNLVMEIDYKKKRVIFTHPNSFTPPKISSRNKSKNSIHNRYHKYPLNVKNQKPYIKAEVSVSRDHRSILNLLLDTGASLPFLVHANTDTTIQLPDKMMIGKVGYGLTGEILGFRGKSNHLTMGDIAFNNIVTSFQDLEDEQLINVERNGIIGNILLERFKVILDYTRQDLYLKPVKKFDREFAFDKSGMTTLAVGPDLDQFYIVSVIKGAPADKAGILPGDLIVKINGKKSKRLTLDKLNKILSRKPGKQVRITLKRGDQEIKKKFELEEWFIDTSKL